MHTSFVSADTIRTHFSRAMSYMYKAEVPQYGSLLEIVASVNASVLEQDPVLAQQLAASDQLSRLDLERHGAIRLGSAQEQSLQAALVQLISAAAISATPRPIQ